MSVRDETLLEVAGLSVSEAATILHRSRQAVNRGVKAAENNYFWLDDILAIYRSLLTRNTFNASKFMEYCRSHYASLDGVSISDVPSIDLEFKNAKSIVVLCNSLEEIENSDRTTWRKLIGFLKTGAGRICHVIFPDAEHERFGMTLLAREQERAQFLAFHVLHNLELPRLRFFPVTFGFVDQDDRSHIYVLTQSGLERLPEMTERRVIKELNREEKFARAEVLPDVA